MEVEEVRWDRGGTAPASEYVFFYGKGNDNHKLRKDFFVHTRFISAGKRVEFVSDRMSHVILIGRWCDIIILTVHILTEYKIYDMKDCKNLWT
jgi:hypothetical protein